MPTPNEIVERALRVSHAATEELVAYIGDAWSDHDEAEIVLAQIAAVERDRKGRDDRESWERHAALQLLLAARCVAEGDERRC
ncbi:MAG: hypothetical protein M3Q48_01250 [Actinomycetota bacterium]|nr:hypothetical protein [Actinomycetota bacterium]